jgi:hypothetical protein
MRASAAKAACDLGSLRRGQSHAPSKQNQNATFAARDELPRKFVHHPVLTLELILVLDRDDVTPYSTGKKAEWQTGLIPNRLSVAREKQHYRDRWKCQGPRFEPEVKGDPN